MIFCGFSNERGFNILASYPRWDLQDTFNKITRTVHLFEYGFWNAVYIYTYVFINRGKTWESVLAPVNQCNP